MSIKLTIRNITSSPQVVHTAGGSKLIQPGELVEDWEFEDGEANNVKGNRGVFLTGADAKKESAANHAGGGDDKEQTRLRAGNDQLKAELANSRGGGLRPSLADAVASLDDANDEHWTKGGLPSIEALETITGGQVSRADVEALPEPRARKMD